MKTSSIKHKLTALLRLAGVSALVIGLMGLLLMRQARASQLRCVTPVTNSIVALYFVDGKSFPETVGAGGNAGRIELTPLDTAKAAGPASYQIYSRDDLNYRVPTAPKKVGRKSKGREFVNTKTPPAVWVPEHWIYVVLPHPMQRGKTYSFSVGDLSTEQKTLSLTFDERRVRSETVHINQIGYVPTAPQKYGYLSAWLGDLGPLPLDEYASDAFHIVDAKSGQAVFSGKPTLRRRVTDGPEGGQPDEKEPHARTDVWQCDFSAFAIPGEYVLVMDGIGCSFPFAIAADAYRQAFITTMRGLYHQRCGIAREANHTRWIRAACHLPATAHYWQVTQRNMDQAYTDGHQNKHPVVKTGEKRDIRGGWHDAGDWDHEAWHPEVINRLLLLFAMAPQKFKDGELNIPESGNAIPDIVDEARWGVDFYTRLQRPDGGVSAGTFADWWPRAGETSTTDSMHYYVYAEEPLATYKYTALACHLAIALRVAGKPDQSTLYAESARRAWDWAGKNMREGDEKKVRDERFHAAAALYKATGDEQFHAAFKRDLVIDSPTKLLSVWNSYDQQWGVWTYVTTNRPTADVELKTRLVQATLHHANAEYVETAQKRAFRYGYNWWVPMFYGAATIPHTLPLMVAHHLSPDAKFLAPQYTTCDYMLGGNPLNMVWVTGLGERSPQEIFHIESWYDNIPELVPGILIFGPHKYTGELPPGIGAWDPRYAQATAYPPAKEWPSHELYFEIKSTPSTNEFTVGSIAEGAAAFGYLCSDN